ncbi:hypothetical protein [Clostridium saccharoperbutylacetonicum]|uniref:hypothetical protein n=1 Tax=Clostridium saccharoperbutylacetonicum TaxID=36745 RepID=UPI0039EB58E5
MEERILQLLKELKENQEEIKADIKKINNRMEDIERDVNCIELVTSRNWMDIIRLKQTKKVLDS